MIISKAQYVAKDVVHKVESTKEPDSGFFAVSVDDQPQMRFRATGIGFRKSILVPGGTCTVRGIILGSLLTKYIVQVKLTV